MATKNQCLFRCLILVIGLGVLCVIIRQSRQNTSFLVDNFSGYNETRFYSLELSEEMRSDIKSTVVVFAYIESREAQEKQLIDVLIQNLCPLSSRMKRVVLQLSSESHLVASEQYFQRAALEICPKGITSLSLTVNTVDKVNDPYRLWHEMAFDWYLEDAELFLFTAPTYRKKGDLIELLDRCYNHGASVAPTGDVCMNVSHYEALGCLFPVEDNPAHLFPPIAWPIMSHFDAAYHAWIPWLVCIYGNKSLVGFDLKTTCEVPLAVVRMTGDRERLRRWETEGRYGGPKGLLGRTSKVISMSLYGNDPKYTYGAFRNAVLARIYFPEWTLRIYIRPKELDVGIQRKLTSLGVVFMAVDSSTTVPPMMWRFLVADDHSVDWFIIRDSDGRIGPRDAAVVKEWLKTNAAFHCIRDHPSHSNHAVSGGLWGARRAELADILKTNFLNMTHKLSDLYLTDMIFLEDIIWPKIQTHAYCHDSYSCNSYPSSHPFPIKRRGAEHLGQVFDRYDVPRAGDMKIISKAPVNEECIVSQ